MTDHTLINGQRFEIVETLPDGNIVVRRPNGTTEYVAKPLPDSPLYGENRSRLVTNRRYLRTSTEDSEQEARPMIGDLCPKCDSVLSPDDEAAVADFGICRACLNKITETDWAAYQAALWEE